jgi:hypothetical protein
VTNSFKRLVTLPWPAYWGQNVISDTFLRLADGGIAAVEPGLMARTMGLLDGTGEILVGGTRIDSRTFKGLLKEQGLNFSNDDYIDVVKSHANMDIDKQLARQRGVVKNLKIGKGSVFDPGAALTVASDNFRDKFENFFRVNQFVHHLERGDSIADARRLAAESMLDYRNLTPTERSVMRRFYMFYGWISKSTKKTINQMFFQPGAIQQQIKGSQAMSEFFSDPNAAPSPDEYDERVLKSLVSSEQLSFPLGKGPTGEKLIGRGFGVALNTPLTQFSLQIPRSLAVTEILDAAVDSTTRTLQKQVASANPFIKGMAELTTGRNLFFDKPLDATFLRRIPSLENAARKIAGFEHDSVPAEVFGTFDKFTQEFLGGVPDGKGNFVVDPGMMWAMTNLVPGLSRMISTGRAFSDERVGLAEASLKTLAGVRIEEGDPTRNFAFDIQRNLEELASQKSLNLLEDQQQEDF